MLKKILLSLFCLLILPVYSGEFEDALSQHENVFLYIYASDCGACKLFNDKYNKLSKMYNNKYGFVKVDADKPYGRILLSTFWGRYVPFVVLVSERNRTVQRIEPGCIMDLACMEKSLKEFQNHKRN